MIAIHPDVDPRLDRLAPMVRIDSWRINVPTQQVLIDRIIEDVDADRSATVFTINLDHLSKLRHEDEFRTAYETATYVSADGAPVVVLARAEGAQIERVTGADLVEPLSRAAAIARIPVYFFGTTPTVLEAAIARLRRAVPDLIVAGAESPPMGFDPKGEAARAAAQRIHTSGAGICFIALGAPKQELFASVAVEETDGVVYLGVGAALDFLAGSRRRAPRWLQVVCLEWLWRTLQEPRRLLPRYAASAIWLFDYVGRMLLGIQPAPIHALDLSRKHDARRER